MNIEVRNKKDSNDYRIYDNVAVIDSSDGKSFIVYIFDTLTHEFAYKDYSWKKLTFDEERFYEISSNDYEEPKYAIGSGSFNHSLVCSDCERVVLIGKRLGNIAEIDPDQIAKLDSIEINGRRFEVIK